MEHFLLLRTLPFVNIRAAAASPAMYMSTDVENYRHHKNFPRHLGECRNTFDSAYQATELLYRIPKYGLTGEKRSTDRLSSQCDGLSGGRCTNDFSFLFSWLFIWGMNNNFTNNYITYARLNWLSIHTYLEIPTTTIHLRVIYCDEVIVWKAIVNYTADTNCD